ncbi:uncharacterized protein LOC135372483 [Ornithodoros turicata]|uniref:uncharacterized protein LOC135372483 n=1 Tax=Ornithodoros turicata TaxID=34597 RepID=UPI003138870D
METPLPPFPAFDPHSDVSSLSQRWLKWVARFENFLLAANVTNEARKRAMLLHYAGEEVYDVFQTLSNTGTDYDTAIARLKEHFAPKRNTVYERHVFRRARQEVRETLDQFQVRLRRLGATCEFSEIEREIVSQIIEGTTSSRLRRVALRESDITLDQLMKLGRSIETTEMQASNIETPSETHTVHNVKEKKFNRRGRPQEKSDQRGRGGTQKCFGCGGRWPHEGGKTNCPAWGARCHKCQKGNHFAKWCRATTLPKEPVGSVNVLSTRSKVSSSEESVFHVQGCTKLPVVRVTVNDRPLDFFLDTGAGVNVIGEQTWRTHLKGRLEETTTRLVPYGITEAIPVMGTFKATFRARDKQTQAPVYVVEGSHSSLLSYETARELMLIDIVRTISQKTSVDAKR